MKKKLKIQNRKIVSLGFTLIELLVVISVIGVLATLVLVSFGPAQKQARDTQRKSDLKQYQTSLEMFANKNNGLYPSYTTTVEASTTLCSILELTNCPEDPKNTSDATFVYEYQSNGTVAGSSTATQYVIWGKLENITGYWIYCSDGQTGTRTTVNPVDGACPVDAVPI